MGVSGMAPCASPFHPLAAIRVVIASGHAGVHGRAAIMNAHRTAVLIAILAPMINLQLARADDNSAPSAAAAADLEQVVVSLR